ncbi:hypothetical protein JR316_0010909 [Psilocybe cubensis]|uniref:Uncharacterized protein n=2 Tax=Psilocybe cubensis TaxID=181762 RepID=A0ACB8GMW5_PSICU|nr:hypothetical protein JR316_0010909 [Psilocybe cubensis]KAH9476993.1 hypothetical protein JR316_0010909 [Psilocybe cubensis]
MPNTTPGSSFGQSLQFITEIKLQELEKQRLAYQAHAKVLEQAKALGDSGKLLEKVEILAKAVKSWKGSGEVKQHSPIVGGKLQLKNLEYWIQQAKYDPNFNPKIVEGWAETLEDHIRHTVMRFDSAKLFGSLFNEWLASGDSATVSYQGLSENQSEFVEVGRKEMYDQKEKLMSIVFDDYPTPVTELSAYLEQLFSSEEAKKVLAGLRRDLKDFGATLQRKTITPQDVRNAISGLLATGLMDEEKRTTLRAFEENSTVLNEVTSVLNMRMASLDTWAWPKEGILVEFRRHFNGKYRAFTDPEIMDALLLHHLGVSWQVKLKGCLTRLFSSKAWIRPASPKQDEKKRRADQLRDSNGGSQEPRSIDVERENNQHTMFFVTQLQETSNQPKPYDDTGDSGQQRTEPSRMSGAQIKQKLLHIITTETYLNTALHGTHAILCSDLEWFGPSLPHTSILTVLEFMGLPKTWLSFLQAFLSAPIRFHGEDEPRTRKRGTPIGYAFSVFCGEAVIFIMDFAVNQCADGLFLHRMHDDLWLWDASAEKVARGWAEMNKYARLVGLKFNDTKTGSAYVGPPEDASGLPKGDIRWGFLVFDPKESRFVLNQEEINKNIVEMRRQLTSTKSVFGWVNTYNKYMSYILRNLGGIPANCFGQAHIGDVIGVLIRIQRELFSDGSGSAVGYLRKTIQERFGVADLPEGYFYFPIGSGGLELRNPLLELLSLQRHGKPLVSHGDQDEFDARGRHRNPDDDDAAAASPEVFFEHTAIADQKFKKRIEHDRKLYAHLKNVWEKDREYRKGKKGVSQEFMSFEEYISLRESWLTEWGNSYRDMLELPKRCSVELVPKVKEALVQTSKSWVFMEWHEQWVVSMYGDEVVKRFGGLDVVDPDLIPVGMVQLFRTSRIKLDQ